MPKTDLPPGALARYQSGAPLQTVSREFGIAETTLRRRLREAGLELRTNEKPVAMDIAEMRRLYEQEGMGAREIGEMIGVAQQTVQRRLRLAGVHVRGKDERTERTRERQSAALASRRKIDKDRLRELHAQGMSCREIAEVFGCNDEVVRRAMIRLDLPRLAPKARPERNHFWQGGYAVDEDGYILEHRPDHPHATNGGYVRQHRLVMERQLGRYLEPGEVVDHKNRDTSDNDPGNLDLYPSNAEHLRATLTGVRLTPEEREQQRQEAVRRAKQRVAAILGASGNGAGQSP